MYEGEYKMNKIDTIAVIRSLLSSTKNTYSVSNLNSDFKSETGIDIPLFGYGNISDFLYSIPDTVKVTGIYPIQKVTLVTNEKSAHIVSLVNRQRNSEPKNRPPRKTRQTSRKLSADHRINGFQKDQMLVENTSVNKFNEQNNIINENVIPSFYPNLILRNTPQGVLSISADGLVPLKHCLGPGETIPHINVQLHAQVGGYVEVHPCQIINPHKFYFHFRKFKKKFSEFRDKLQLFYATHSTPKVTDEAIRPKMICAVFYEIHKEPTWHRVEILEIVNECQVLVNFVDHGDVVKMSKENLKYLHRDFSSFPRQASLGFLANIRPAKGRPEWSPAAINRFFDLSFGKDLVAGVVHVNPKDFCLRIALSFTKGKEIHINDTLVKEGFAEFDKSVLDHHVITRLKTKSECNESSVGHHKKGTLSSEKIKKEKGLTNEISKAVQRGVSPKLETPVFYFSYNCIGNNSRLKKMFSFSEQK